MTQQQIFDWTVEGKLKYVLEPKTSNFTLTKWDNGHVVRVNLASRSVVATLPPARTSIGFTARFIICGVDDAQENTLTINNGTDAVFMYRDGLSNVVSNVRMVLSAADGVCQYVDVFSDGAKWSIYSSNSVKNNATLAFENTGLLDLDTETSFTSMSGLVVSSIPSDSIVALTTNAPWTLYLGSKTTDIGKTLNVVFTVSGALTVATAATSGETVNGIFFDGVGGETHHASSTSSVVVLTGATGDIVSFTNINGSWYGSGSVRNAIS